MGVQAGTSEGDFLAQLATLACAEVDGMDTADKAAALRGVASRLLEDGCAPTCSAVPFVPGRRPLDEAVHPGLGSSDQAALILGAPGDRNRAYLLFQLPERLGPETGADLTLRLAGPDGGLRCAPLPGWDRRAVDLKTFDTDGEGRARLRPAREGDRVFVVPIAPEETLFPGAAWAWDDLDPSLRADALGGDRDPYGLGHLFLQRLRVECRLTHHAVPVAAAHGMLDVCDVRRLGSLYARVLEDLLVPDTERQAAAAGVDDPGHEYHPWFPVLRIGGDKADLYTRALVADIVDKERYLTDPAWLLRVGIYLELLTFLGIVEAVRDDADDLLTPAERRAFDHAERFAEVRRRIDPHAWREVWDLRHIAFPRLGTPRAGSVSLLNLLNKKRATLKFLHVHHEDLKHAIDLAGANDHNSQETWQRVFRDAERAVLRQTTAAFPELGFLPAQAREFVLWHRRGRFEVGRALRIPGPVSALLADQDGLFPSACNEYRGSMNFVATWAKERGLMDHAGADCISHRASLIEAEMNRPEHVRVLQRRDGYGDSLDVGEALAAPRPPVDDAEELLRTVPIFAMLAPEQLRMLARTARPLPLGPTERFVVQGSEGTSLFVVADGEVEVVLRRDDGPDMHVDSMGRGAVVGEMSLLTGEPRSATVRAADGALVYEIGQACYEPLLREHPEWVDDLAQVMEERLRDRHERLDAYDVDRQRSEIRRRIVGRFFGGQPESRVGSATPAD